jgi:hypothetical protein
MAPASHKPGPLSREGQGLPEPSHAYLQSVAARPWRIRLLVEPGRGVLGLARVLPSKSPQRSTASCAASIGTSTGRWRQGRRCWPCTPMLPWRSLTLRCICRRGPEGYVARAIPLYCSVC